MNRNSRLNLQRFAEADMVSREDANSLIPEQVSKDIIQAAVQGSAVLQLGRKLPNMTSNRMSMPVLDMRLLST